MVLALSRSYLLDHSFPGPFGACFSEFTSHVTPRFLRGPRVPQSDHRAFPARPVCSLHTQSSRACRDVRKR